MPEISRLFRRCDSVLWWLAPPMGKICRKTWEPRLDAPREQRAAKASAEKQNVDRRRANHGPERKANKYIGA
jgi:hypothetical protein